MNLAEIATRHWLSFCLIATALAAAYRAAGWLRPSWRHVARLALLLGALRLVLIGNPVVWHVYAEVLTPREIGLRQHDAIRAKRDQFHSGGVRYLAVGSSQTGAIYDAFARDRKDLDAFVVAAMQPLDFFLYRDYIARHEPERILLYLSDFDIARRPPPEPMAFAPAQGMRLLTLWKHVRALPDLGYGRALTEMVVGEFFPEYKYRFVFRGLVDKAMWRVGRRIGRKDDPRPGQAFTEEDYLRWARESMMAEYIPFNMAVLRDYLEFATAHGSEVVIVEGHYNPHVSTAAIAQSAKRVDAALRAVADSMEGVTFLPRSAILELSESDYSDLSHVKPQVGYEFAARLVELLEQGIAREGGIPQMKWNGKRPGNP